MLISLSTATTEFDRSVKEQLAAVPKREKFSCVVESRLNMNFGATRKMGKSENFELHWLYRHIWSHWLPPPSQH